MKAFPQFSGGFLGGGGGGFFLGVLLFLGGVGGPLGGGGVGEFIPFSYLVVSYFSSVFSFSLLRISFC